jgi:hypothetical protein
LEFGGDIDLPIIVFVLDMAKAGMVHAVISPGRKAAGVFWGKQFTFRESSFVV